jgi:DNA-binding MarR family transcriptional regulator
MLPGLRGWPAPGGMSLSDRKLQTRPNGARSGANGPRPQARKARTARKRRKDIKLGGLEGHLGYFIRRIQVWVFQDFIRKLANADIRPAQYSVLTVIGANPGLSQSDLADTLAIERARLVHLLDRLEKRGLTERQPSPKDRRSHALHLTPEGQKVLKRLKALAARHEAHLIETLGAENYRTALLIFRQFANGK